MLGPVSALRHAPRTSLPGRRGLCSASKDRTVSADIPLGVGVATGGLAGYLGITRCWRWHNSDSGVGQLHVLIATSYKRHVFGAVAIAATVGAWNYIESGACNVPLALMTTFPAILGTKYGVQTAHGLSSKKLSLFVGSAMLLCSPLIFLKNSSYMPKWSDKQDPVDLQFFVPQQKDLVKARTSLNDDETHTSMASMSTAVSAEYMERVKADWKSFALVNAKYVFAGAAAGFISGLCGLGGGILITSYLTAASDMPQATIIGTSLLSEYCSACYGFG